MNIVVGIDIGGSTTKIAGFDGDKLLVPVQIVASNAIASVFGAFGKFLYDNKLELRDISEVHLTGGGAQHVEQAIYGLPTFCVDEFTANGLGGGYFAENKSKFMVVSMGTGTSFVGVVDGVPIHFGGIGIGGGTIVGLSKYILHTNDMDRILEMAEEGNVGKIDLRICDISNDPLPGLNLDITASNFGKASSRATEDDRAAGIVHMVVESICQTAALISQRTDIRELVLIGTLTKLKQCLECSAMVESLFPDTKFTVPDYGEYATAIGAALAGADSAKRIA